MNVFILPSYHVETTIEIINCPKAHVRFEQNNDFSVNPQTVEADRLYERKGSLFKKSLCERQYKREYILLKSNE